MAATLVLLLFSFASFATFNCLASEITSEQIKFWSENVRNKIPAPILKKLSPLSKNDCYYYSNMMSKNAEFHADAGFCSLAKLACDSALEDVKTISNRYTTEKTYNNNGATLDVQKNEDPFSFFRLSILKKGNLVHLPNLQESLSDTAFLPLQIASQIPLNIREITKLFPGSAAEGATKETIVNTLSYCNAAAIKGEVKSCPRSLEEMISFSKSVLGGKRLISLTSKNNQGSNTNLMVKNVKKFNTDKIVACHEAYLPFAAFFCHSLSSTSLYSVDLVEPKSTGAPVNTLLAICHMDTSPWPENHVAFKILKLRPGEGEACHWFTQVDLAWILDRESM
ncbi:polygalacturonase-1 non-catalytic subunit beta-like [Henckelia pumila]|uniref:polygalacturonase-1 non-catalytic subunit beta-like n=1 Tax=Henckelia pumila TaxID=405737 RepID=UPI003C6E6727